LVVSVLPVRIRFLAAGGEKLQEHHPTGEENKDLQELMQEWIANLLSAKKSNLHIMADL